MRVTVWPAGSLEDRPPPDPTSPGSPDTGELGSGLCREQTNPLGNVTKSAINRTSPASETIAERPRNLAIGKNASRSSIHTHLLDTTSPESPAAEELTSGIAAECPASPEFLRTKLGEQEASAPQVCQESPEAPLTHTHTIPSQPRVRRPQGQPPFVSPTIQPHIHSNSRTHTHARAHSSSPRESHVDRPRDFLPPGLPEFLLPNETPRERNFTPGVEPEGGPAPDEPAHCEPQSEDRKELGSEIVPRAERVHSAERRILPPKSPFQRTGEQDDRHTETGTPAPSHRFREGALAHGWGSSGPSPTHTPASPESNDHKAGPHSPARPYGHTTAPPLKSHDPIAQAPTTKPTHPDHETIPTPADISRRRKTPAMQTSFSVVAQIAPSPAATLPPGP
ncbi:uncharacterized protein LOC133318946 [Danaus plexippus]|uniref:uncharacterized protein LOC133318946 n=1 Tax=Danaus plexippus TaxID=13037 RepID=UPI002AAFC765|nr:uncharacterized protein LOC133318946 [Danaus plexippus]